MEVEIDVDGDIDIDINMETEIEIDTDVGTDIRHCLKSQVSQNNRSLYPKVAHDWDKTAPR